MEHIRKARTDNSVKAIVIRINSGGGSAMASEVIWREVNLAKKEKPVIVSFGDYATSGGYYIACAADSIFAQENTITGSIGVFTVVPNMQKFFNNKLGITFDGVSTGENADLFKVTKPLSPVQKQYLQSEIDSIYKDFKNRVSQGRNKSEAYIDSIAQGRIWSGSKAVQIGLVDRIGGLNEAIAAAASKAKIKDYRLREYPGKQSIREMIFGDDSEVVKEEAVKKELGEQFYKIYSFARDIKQSAGKAQARMPFEMIIE
jgi:protease-4